jgi:hypothetical protein
LQLHLQDCTLPLVPAPTTSPFPQERLSSALRQTLATAPALIFLYLWL